MHTSESDAKSLAERQRQLANSIDSYVKAEGAEHDFKYKISIYFTVLVGLVIVGFFVIAFKDPAVGREIFSGDAGLQFVTLFALVIAIILFGVIGVFDGKELAALLGGLSGYILGHSNAVTRTGSPEGAEKHA